MTLSEAKMTLDYVKKYYEIPDEGLKIQFTGGEPFLVFDKILTLIEYCKIIGLKAQFMIQTNGTLINKRNIESIKKYQIGIGISLDGLPQYHDLNRPYFDGRGSCQDVIAGLQQLSCHGLSVGVTVTLNRDNILGLRALIPMLSLLGVKGLSLDLFRPIGRGKNKNLAVDENLMIEKVQEAIDEINYLVDLGASPIVIKEMEKMKTALSHKLSRCVYCYALSGASFAVVPGGDIYPCSSFAGDETYLLGNITDQVDLKAQLVNFGSRFNLLNYHECLTCTCKDICGGGCVARGLSTSKDMRVNVLECALKKLYIKNIRGER